MNETNGWDVLLALVVLTLTAGPLCLIVWLMHKENTRD